MSRIKKLGVAIGLSVLVANHTTYQHTPDEFVLAVERDEARILAEYEALEAKKEEEYRVESARLAQEHQAKIAAIRTEIANLDIEKVKPVVVQETPRPSRWNPRNWGKREWVVVVSVIVLVAIQLQFEHGGKDLLDEYQPSSPLESEDKKTYASVLFESRVHRDEIKKRKAYIKKRKAYIKKLQDAINRGDNYDYDWEMDLIDQAQSLIKGGQNIISSCQIELTEGKKEIQDWKKEALLDITTKKKKLKLPNDIAHKIVTEFDDPLADE